MITNELMNAVVVIASCKLLASVRESEDQRLGPSLHIPSMQLTIEVCSDWKICSASLRWIHLVRQRSFSLGNG